MSFINSRIFRTSFLLLATFLLPHCTNSKGGGGLTDGGIGGKTPFDGNFSGDLADSLAGNGNTGGTVGSGSTGNLTDADKQALANLTGEMEDVNTNEGGLSKDLIDEAQRLLDEEANTDASGEKKAQIQAAKMALVGKILQDCAEKAAPLAPIPGQPLMGVWTGGGACGVEFAVVSTGPQPVYKITNSSGVPNTPESDTPTQVKKATKDDKNKKSSGGGTQLNGQMVASADGQGQVKADPFSGSLTDSPRAGTGKLVHPTFNKSKSGTSPCEVAVNLKRSTNPIPENYVQAMKQVGKCHRQALLFLSPVMDKMFKNMPSNLSSILMNRAIGVPR